MAAILVWAGIGGGIVIVVVLLYHVYRMRYQMKSNQILSYLEYELNRFHKKI